MIDGKSLKRYGYKLNLLTEIAYQNVKDDIGVLSNQAVLDKLDEIATLLLNGKIDSSSSTSLAYNDLITWLPSFDKGLLFYNYNSRFAPIVSKIYKDENISQDAYDVVYGKSPTPRIKSDIFELNENASGGTLVGEINILDEGQSPIESLTLLGNGSENFFLDSNNDLRVAPTAQLDFETTKAYNLKVLARNAQGESSANITIFIRDLLDAPVIAYVDINDTFSNAAPFSLVGQVEFNQGTSTITQMTLTGNGEKYFNIDPSGRITISSIGLESIPESTTFSLTLKAKNDSGYSREVTLPFHVIKVADGIPTLKNFSGSINENIAGGSLVGKVSFDIGASPINAFILAGNGSENFTIDLEGTIRVKDGAVLDYETTPYYKFSTSARNANGTSKSATVTITINNLEDANENVPVLIDNKTFSVDEDVPSGTFIGNVLKTSGLSQVQSISCSDPKFYIDTDGSLYLNEDEQLDYETKTTHYITAIAKNDYGQSVAKTYTIAVNNVVDVPTLTPLVTNVPENSPQGTVVGTISFDEGTSPIETIAFTNSPEFSIDMQGVIRIKSGVTLDYEMKQSYALQAYATNASGTSPLVNVMINIGNLLDAPELQNISYTVEENSQNITLPTNLVVNEGLTPITSIKIFGHNGSQSSSLRADINGTVYITDVANLDYETTTPIFYVKAYNNEGVSKTTTIHLNLINVLDAPELNSFSGYIDENATIGTVVGQLTFNPGLSPVSSMVLFPSSDTPPDPIPCSIDENGTLRLITHLDYEKKTSYSFRAYAINDQGKSRPVSIGISVNDVLDSPILHTLYTDVNESIHGGELIGTISYQEGLDAITSMSLYGADSEKFRVDVNGNIYLKANEKLNFEEKNSYNFYAQAFSPSYNSNIVDIHVTVNEIDEYGIAGIGRWSNADVKIYKVENNASKTLVYTDTTSVGNDIDAIGLFDSHKLDLNESVFYIYEVNGGKDNDIDNDGIIDPTPTTNKGTIHAIIKGSWVRDSDWRPRINLLTEVYYQWAKEYLDDLEELENRLLNPQQYQIYISKDLNGDSSSSSYFGNALDAILYDPVKDTSEVWNPRYFPVYSLKYMQEKKYENDPHYALFVLNSFMYPTYLYNDISVSAESKKVYSFAYRQLKVFDMNDIYNPVETIIMHQSFEMVATSKDDKYLFAKRYIGEYILEIYDISNTEEPVKISSTSVENFNSMRLSEDETKLYMTFSNNTDNGLRVMDIQDLTNPVLGTTVHTPGNALYLVLSKDNKTAYLTDDRGGLKIIDISDPNHFKIVGEYIANGLVQSVQLSKDETKAFISIAAPTSNLNTQKGHIQVIDITDKSNPSLFKDLDLNSSEITTFKFNANKTKLFVSHGYPEYNDKIYEIKGDFEEFKLLGETPHSYYTSSDKLILLENETIMLAISSYKIDVIDISNPENPIITNTIQLQTAPS